MTDIGLTGGGKGNNMLYLSGVQSNIITNENILTEIIKQVEKKAEEIETSK